MSFMRLGTRVAVLNDEGHLLLSKRGDFGTWSLPGGRMDSGELLPDSAAREVREETGLEVEITHTVGMYFQQGRARTNFLYAAKPIGGELMQATDETLENRFFPPDALPENRFGQFYIDDVLSGGVHVRTQETPRIELLKLRWKLALRYVQNMLAGRPEPRFPQFDVWSVGIVWGANKQSVLVRDARLPRVRSAGNIALDAALSRYLHQPKMRWRWVGLWQDTASDTLEFVFEALQAPDNAQSPQEFETRDHAYLVRTRNAKLNDVWLMTRT